MFGETSSAGSAHGPAAPDWLAEAREALVASGDYLAFETDDRVQVVALQDGWTRVGRSLPPTSASTTRGSRGARSAHRDSTGEVNVLDDRSLNGVFKNGEGMDMAPLRDGDTIPVGRFNLHFICLRGEQRRNRGSRTAAGAVG